MAFSPVSLPLFSLLRFLESLIIFRCLFRCVKITVCWKSECAWLHGVSVCVCVYVCVPVRVNVQIAAANCLCMLCWWNLNSHWFPEISWIFNVHAYELFKLCVCPIYVWLVCVACAQIFNTLCCFLSLSLSALLALTSIVYMYVFYFVLFVFIILKCIKLCDLVNERILFRWIRSETTTTQKRTLNRMYSKLNEARFGLDDLMCSTQSKLIYSHQCHTYVCVC